MSRTSVAAFFLLAALSWPSVAATRAGVDFPEKLTVEGRELTLNGLGVRRKFVIDVYVGALYLEKRTTEGPQVIRSQQVKHVEMVFVREVDREPLVEAFSEGFERNAPDPAAVKARLDELLARVTAVKKGERMKFTFVPGQGTTLVIGGRTHTIPGEDFAQALLSVWFGKKVADPDLAEGMLGD